MSILYRLFSRAIRLLVIGGGLMLTQLGTVHAQADLNIQSRIDAVTQPFQVQPVPITPDTGKARPDPDNRSERVVVVKQPPCLERDHHCLSPSELREHAKQRTAKSKKLNSLTKALGPERFEQLLTDLQAVDTSMDDRQKIKRLFGLQIVITPSKPKTFVQPDIKPHPTPGKDLDQAPVQPTTFKLIFPIGPIYETTATKTPVALAHADTSITLGGGFQFTTQGVGNLDVIGVTAGTTSTRYTSLTSRNLDILSTAVQYQLFLGAYDGSGKWINLSHGSYVPSGQVSFNTLTFGVQTSTAFAPTFRAESLNLVTPTVIYGWQNLPLGGGPCTTKLAEDTAKPGQKVGASFCYYIDVSATVGHTSSDVSLQENTNFGVSATLGDRIAHTDLVALLATAASGKVYDSVPGGRRDLLLQIGPKLQFSPAAGVSTSIAASYNQNSSTVAAAAWHGWIVQTQLSVAFTPK